MNNEKKLVQLFGFGVRAIVNAIMANRLNIHYDEVEKYQKIAKNHLNLMQEWIDNIVEEK